MKGSVELSTRAPADGQRSLRILASAIDPEEAPVVIETPPIWITTPPINAAAGTLLEIVAKVRVPNSIEGSVDGLLVFDSYGGPALAERVNKTENWRRLVLYRIVLPAQASNDGISGESPPPLTVTFALTGLGEAQIDSVSIKLLREASVDHQSLRLLQEIQTSQNLTKFSKESGSGIPSDDNTTQSNRANTAWPGMSLEWPKMLPFTSPETTPPQGPSGSTIDPFKGSRHPLKQP